VTAGNSLFDRHVVVSFVDCLKEITERILSGDTNSDSEIGDADSESPSFDETTGLNFIFSESIVELDSSFGAATTKVDINWGSILIGDSLLIDSVDFFHRLPVISAVRSLVEDVTNGEHWTAVLSSDSNS